MAAANCSAPRRAPEAPAFPADYYDAQNNVKAAREQLAKKEKEASIRKLRTRIFEDFPDASVDASEEIMRASLRRIISEAQTRRKQAPQGMPAGTQPLLGPPPCPPVGAWWRFWCRGGCP